MEKKAKVLIIDDEEDIGTFSKSILEKTGLFEVVTTTKPSSGIILAKTEKPDLILLDLCMSEMDGSELAEVLLKDSATASIPVVFLTALVKETEVTEGQGQIGGRAFISKPVAPAELVRRVKVALNMAD